MMPNMQQKTLSIFAQKQREVHINRDLRIFGYLNHHLQSKIHCDQQQVNTDGIYLFMLINGEIFTLIKNNK